MANPPPSSSAPAPACVLCFNASDPTGAQGITGDALTVASVGVHALPVLTGAWTRDTLGTHGWHALDADLIEEQARAALEDMPVRAIKVGFAGSAEALAALATVLSDYDDQPVITYMPELSWWEPARIESYLDTCSELLLPLTSVLVGNHASLQRWLLPDWTGDAAPGARDLAAAAAAQGAVSVLATGLALPGERIDNLLASANSVMARAAFGRIAAHFCGAGDTLSAALAALLAQGSDLTTAAGEALLYLDQALAAGIHPGMGRAMPDRLFWAQADDAPSGTDADEGVDTAPDLMDFPFHDTHH